MCISQTTYDPTGTTTGQLISPLVQKHPSMTFDLPEDDMTNNLIVNMAKPKYKSTIRPPSMRRRATPAAYSESYSITIAEGEEEDNDDEIYS